MPHFLHIKIKLVLLNIVLWVSLLTASAAYSQTTVIYQDDFEGTISGWSDNSDDFAPAVTRFLGRFANGQTTTSRTFTVPPNSDELRIAFDLYRFDSWDNNTEFGFDRFEVDIDGVQLFSLPFPAPQAARSGASGNIAWSHTPLTGREELGFNSGQFWFDQLHRFEIVISNPGASVELTLRADVTQPEFDESAGYDNFLVTAGPPTNDILAVAESFALIDGSVGGDTISVLTSDTINGAALNPNDVTITSTTSSSSNVTLNPSTGLITVSANTAAGTYTVDYEICENINTINCSSVTETVEVFVPVVPGSCPAGSAAVPGTYFVVSASVSPSTGGQPNNLNGALGAPLPEGSVVTDENNSGTTFSQSLVYDLTGDPNLTVPEGAVIDLSFANHFNSNPSANISSSLDGVNYDLLGSSTGAWTNNTFRYDAYTVPSGGARFIEVDYNGGGGLRFDGAIYQSQCQPASAPVTLAANKTVSVYDPQNLGLYALPGNDVIYTISVENTGTGDVDSESLILIDSMPSEVIFYNDDIDDAGPETNPVAFQGTGSGLTFDNNTDVGYSDASVAPSSFAECSYVPASGYDPNVNFICINPTGSMAGGSTWSVSFRARIE